MNPIRKLREKTGFTQAELAKVGGTSQPTIAAYESGDKSLTMRTLQKLTSASGLELDICFASRLTREEQRSLNLHRAIARKLEAEPKAVLEKAKRVLHRMMAKHPSAAPLLQQWKILLKLPVTELKEILVDIRPHARELRQVTPFAGILNACERKSVYLSFQNKYSEENK